MSDERPLGGSPVAVGSITIGTSGLGRRTARGGGRSEEVLGDALARRSAPAPLVVTKADRHPATTGSYGYRPVPAGLAEWLGTVERLCDQHGTTLVAAALHHFLRSPLVDSTVIGLSSGERLAELGRQRSSPPREELWSALADLGPAPTPVAEES